MRGYNKGAKIPERNLSDVKPMRFNLIVKLLPEEPTQSHIIIPESVQRHKDSTRGWLGEVIAVGESISRMERMVGKLVPGRVCLFDESVSIDDPNRCFNWGRDRYVLFDVDTVMGVIDDRHGIGVASHIKMFGDRVLARRPKRDDFKITKSKLWIPAGHERQEIGGVVVVVGPGLYNPDRKRYLPMSVKQGEFVLFPKYGYTDIRVNGIDYVVVRQDKILAVVEGCADGIEFTEDQLQEAIR